MPQPLTSSPTAPAAGMPTSIRRWGEPADIGKAAVTLASGSLHYSSGDAIHVDGGLHIHRL